MRAMEPARRAWPGVGPDAGDDPGVGAGPGTEEASGATPLVGRPSWLRIEIWRIRHCQRRKASRIRSLAQSSRTTFESDCIDPHRYAEESGPSDGFRRAGRRLRRAPERKRLPRLPGGESKSEADPVGRTGTAIRQTSSAMIIAGRERAGRRDGVQGSGKRATPRTGEPPAGDASGPTLNQAAGSLPERPPRVGEPRLFGPDGSCRPASGDPVGRRSPGRAAQPAARTGNGLCSGLGNSMGDCLHG